LATRVNLAEVEMIFVERTLDKAWFEMRAETRRRLSRAVWIPLKQSHTDKIGEYGQLGYRAEYQGLHSAAIKLEHRAQGEAPWTSSWDTGVWVSDGIYKPAEVLTGRDGAEIGVALVLVQTFDSAEPSIWWLNQDLVFALGLLQEGDVWVRPSEGYEEVVRLERNGDGRPSSIKIRADYLGDYLAARGMALRIATYRDRSEIVRDAAFADWKPHPTADARDDGRFEGRAWPIHPGGNPYESTAAVFQMSRTDVDTEAEVPIMDPASDEGVESRQWTIKRKGEKIWRIEGAFWRDEWIEPAQTSPRVRHDHVASTVSFIVDGAGRRQNADELDFDEVGKWLWFSPTVMPAFLERRGAKMVWYTLETGGLQIAGGMPVHFGVNERGLINVYACDVARLDEWERRIWAGFNVGPDGGVSPELTAAQVHTDPADTQAPEAFLGRALKELDAAFSGRFGAPLLKPHDDHEQILRKAHRFRVSDRTSLWGLAKDIARLTADSFDVASLRTALSLGKDDKVGTLKGVQRLLDPLIGKDKARGVMAPLVGVYDLRLGDAHLPSSDIDEALMLVQIDSSLPWPMQGRDLLSIVVSVLYAIEDVFTHAPVPEK